MSEAGSRDLSGIFRGPLKVTIEGVGTQQVIAPRLFPLARLVLMAETMCKGQIFTTQQLRTLNCGVAPWEIVAFDPEARKLVVKPV